MPPTLAPEVIKHRNEYPKEASDRWFASTSTNADIIDLVLWELAECMYSSEPEAPKNGLSVDSWHASACALRCYAMILRLKDKLDTSNTPLASPADDEDAEIAKGLADVRAGRTKPLEQIRREMAFDEAMKLLDRDESFKATVYAMNTILLKKGVYSADEFDQLFIQYAVNFKKSVLPGVARPSWEKGGVFTEFPQANQTAVTRPAEGADIGRTESAPVASPVQREE